MTSTATTGPGHVHAAAGPAPGVRAVAFYLPQFHPTPENDEWWGPGFTEWTNVARARPLFRGHAQPRVPADLGFYDLRLPESRTAQATLAARYGIEAFCYWHYWFAGRRILERPFDEVLASGRPDLKFCLAWANQTWSGIWHGAADKILIEQTYPGPEDDRRHFDHLLPAFTDPRYLTVDRRPVFYVFRPEQLPDPRGFVARWQSMARSAGLPGLYLLAEVSDLLGKGPAFADPRGAGFDAGVYVRLPVQRTRGAVTRMRLRRRLLRQPERYPHATHLPEPPGALSEDVLPCVYPNWDNTPRSARRGLVVEGSSPALFAGQLREAHSRLTHRPEQERLLFVKSWNEWAEGNHLEPDLTTGHGYLRVLATELGTTLHG